LDSFIRGFDPSHADALTITSNDKWISVHPVVLSMIAALGLTTPPGHVQFDKLEAKSKHYLVRMGLFKILKVPSDISVVEHEPAGINVEWRVVEMQVIFKVQICFRRLVI
jgi:hypothetical protein